jgi:HlyD family secretion protein
MKWSFRIVSLVLGLALLAAVVAALRPRPIDVEVAAVTRGLLEQKVVDDGKARVRERYTVSAPVAGTLARIELHEGDLVEPGSVLARLLPLPSPLLDPRSRQVAGQRLASALDVQRQSQATVTRAETASDDGRRELQRVTQLASQGAVPDAQLDRTAAEARMRESELASARFAERVAAHEIEQARSALETFRPGARVSEQLEITSPVHGKVLHVLHQSEGVVEAGTPLAEVGDPQALELVVDVLSQDAVALRPGMVAHVVHWGGERPLEAKVRRVEPAAFTRTSALGVDEQRVNVVLDIVAPADEWRALGDGFAVEIEITLWSRPDVMKVPTSALFRDGAAWAAFVVEGGRAVTRRVQPGHRGALETEVVDGLQVDDLVVVHPGASVRAGVRVAHR